MHHEAVAHLLTTPAPPAVKVVKAAQEFKPKTDVPRCSPRQHRLAIFVREVSYALQMQLNGLSQ